MAKKSRLFNKGYFLMPYVRCVVCQINTSNKAFCSNECLDIYIVKNGDDIKNRYITEKISVYNLSKSLGIPEKYVTKLLTENKIIRKVNPNYPGRKVGKLTVLERAYNKDGTIYHKKWKCQCDCGNIIYVATARLNVRPNQECSECSIGKRIVRKNINYMDVLIRNLFYTSKTRGWTVQLTSEYLIKLFEKQGGKCVFTNVDIWSPKNHTERQSCKYTASLDRIDSTKAYIEGNVQWVHKKVNMMKGKLSNQEFAEWCRLVHENFKAEVDIDQAGEYNKVA